MLELCAPTADQVASLERLADEAGIAMEDWTANVCTLCRQCSEGTPHDTHDHSPNAAWQVERKIGLAATQRSQIDVLIEACGGIDGLVLGKVAMALPANND